MLFTWRTKSRKQKEPQTVPKLTKLFKPFLKQKKMSQQYVVHSWQYTIVMSPKQKCHQNWNVTKTKISPKFLQTFWVLSQDIQSLALVALAFFLWGSLHACLRNDYCSWDFFKGQIIICLLRIFFCTIKSQWFSKVLIKKNFFLITDILLILVSWKQMIIDC